MRARPSHDCARPDLAATRSPPNYESTELGAVPFARGAARADDVLSGFRTRETMEELTEELASGCHIEDAVRVASRSLRRSPPRRRQVVRCYAPTFSIDLVSQLIATRAMDLADMNLSPSAANEVGVGAPGCCGVRR